MGAPTLGYYVLDWIEHYLRVPDGPMAGDPLTFTPEQAQFVLNFYAVDSATGKRRVRRAVYSRPKGSGKSPMMAALMIAEACADVAPDGFDSSGEPVGRPWHSLGFRPRVQVAAVSEDQTSNTWEPLLDMVRYGQLRDDYAVEALETFVNVPGGRIDFVTSQAASREGFRPMFTVMDQTESWTASNGGKRLAATIRRNATKLGGHTIETPNAFQLGMDSVAEASWGAWQAQIEGRLRGDNQGILFDHRSAPAETSLTDSSSLREGLRFAYGCASADARGCLLPGHKHAPGWVDIDRVVQDIWDPSTDPADARRYFLNQMHAAEDAWITQVEWEPLADATVVVADRTTVTLGFDGSIRDDATALIGCVVESGHLFTLGVWERPDGVDDWQVPREEVDAAVSAAMSKYRVVMMAADPPHWQDQIDRWRAEFGGEVVKEWWTNRSRAMVATLERFHTAVTSAELTHDGDSRLSRHVLNARRRVTRSGLTIGKETPKSARKIDAAMAAVLAYEARNDAFAAGLHETKRRTGRVAGF